MLRISLDWEFEKVFSEVELTVHLLLTQSIILDVQGSNVMNGVVGS